MLRTSPFFIQLSLWLGEGRGVSVFREKQSTAAPSGRILMRRHALRLLTLACVLARCRTRGGRSLLIWPSQCLLPPPKDIPLLCRHTNTDISALISVLVKSNIGKRIDPDVRADISQDSWCRYGSEIGRSEDYSK